jgi:hypothetical protein
VSGSHDPSKTGLSNSAASIGPPRSGRSRSLVRAAALRGRCASYHDRMPLAFADDKVALWLDLS